MQGDDSGDGDEEEKDEEADAADVEGEDDSGSDHSNTKGNDGENSGEDMQGDVEEYDTDEQEQPSATTSKKRKLPTKASLQKAKAISKSISEGYGVSRGLDFQGVNFVINFDLPPTAAAYTHRIGRTARGGASGTALSFITTADASTRPADKIISNRDTQV